MAGRRTKSKMQYQTLPKTEVITDEQLESRTWSLTLFMLHFGVFFCACIFLDLWWLFNTNSFALILLAVWLVAFSEHAFRASVRLGYSVWKEPNSRAYHDKKAYLAAIREAQRKGLHFAWVIKTTYGVIVGIHILPCLVFVILFAESGNLPLNEILKPALLSVVAILASAIHAFTVYLRGGFRTENRKAKPQFNGLMSMNDGLSQDVDYVVSDDGELVEVDGGRDTEKRKPHR